MTYIKKFFVPALVLAMILMFTGCGAEIEYDPHEYIDIGFYGLNGYGTILFMDKHDELNSKLSQKEKENIEYMLDVTTYEITPYENLKNGDVVKIKPIIDEKLCQEKKLKPVVREREVVVTDLKEPIKVITLFEDVEPDYLGENGEGSVLLYYRGNDDFVYDVLKITYPKEKRDFKNGDTFEARISHDYEKATSKGYVFIGETTKEFTVTGLPEPKKD